MLLKKSGMNLSLPQMVLKILPKDLESIKNEYLGTITQKEERTQVLQQLNNESHI